MPKKGGKKKKELQDVPSGAPDEVQQASQSSSGPPSGVQSQAPTESQPPRRGGTQAAGGCGRGSGIPRQEGEHQQLPSAFGGQDQKGPATGRDVPRQHHQQGGGHQGQQQRQPDDRGRGGGRGQGRRGGFGRGRSPRYDVPRQQQQFPPIGQGPKPPAWRQSDCGPAQPTATPTQEAVLPKEKPPAWGQHASQPAEATAAVPKQEPGGQESSFEQAAVVELVAKQMTEVSLEEKPPISSSTDLQKKVPIEILNIPKRKDFSTGGTLGHKITVLANMMQIILGPEFKPNIIHYDINNVPDKPKYLMEKVFEEARKQLFPEKRPAFDGKKNAYSAGLLPIDNPKTVRVTVFNEEGKEKQYEITFKIAAQLDLSWLKNVGPGFPQTEVSQAGMQALDIILRNAPLMKRATPVGRSFFMPPRDSITSLGGGMDLWVGHYQTAVLGWKPFLNIDVAHKGFPKPQPVIDLMKTICGCDGQGGGSRGPPYRGPPGRQAYNQGPINLNNDLIGQYREDIERFLKGLKVAYEIPKRPTTRRIQKVIGLAPCPRDNCFELSDGTRVTVEKYYKLEKKYEIVHPNLPCLWIGNEKKKIHVPVELCTIVAGQVTQKKLDENQTSQMIRHAATGTEDRKKKIMEAFTKMNYNEDPCMKEFGISVNGQFQEVPARVLNPTNISYKNKVITVSKGQWRIDGSQFLESTSSISGDNTWTILNLNFKTRDDELYDFADRLKQIASNLGVKIGKEDTPFVKVDTRRNCTYELRTHFTSFKSKGIKLVIVIVPENKGPYNWVKQVSELNVGILTQCLRSKTLFKIRNDRFPATLNNILLKINAKLNGTNHAIAQRQSDPLPSCFTEPCMIVGADVTHPPPDSQHIPSIAAVVASHDRRGFQYNAEVRLQPPNEETILELAEMMKIQLVYFIEKTGYWPRRIVFYRDGVGEGYFGKVLRHEIPAIRKACKAVAEERKIEETYEPPITFFVVQKRHHTRLFPANPNETDDKNRNVRAGTIVDTEITHPTDIEFYLVSHASIQGTARPTKYRCLWNDDDQDMSQDEMELLTYYLCHMFSRCTRTVSYPAPAYNAHLAAFRARVWTQDVNIDLKNLSQEQKRKLTARPEVLKGYPMFFS